MRADATTRSGFVYICDVSFRCRLTSQTCCWRWSGLLWDLYTLYTIHYASGPCRVQRICVCLNVISVHQCKGGGHWLTSFRDGGSHMLLSATHRNSRPAPSLRWVNRSRTCLQQLHITRPLRKLSMACYGVGIADGTVGCRVSGTHSSSRDWRCWASCRRCGSIVRQAPVARLETSPASLKIGRVKEG